MTDNELYTQPSHYDYEYDVETTKHPTTNNNAHLVDDLAFAWTPQQPDYDPNDPFGLLNQMTNAPMAPPHAGDTTWPHYQRPPTKAPPTTDNPDNPFGLLNQITRPAIQTMTTQQNQVQSTIGHRQQTTPTPVREQHGNTAPLHPTDVEPQQPEFNYEYPHYGAQWPEYTAPGAIEYDLESTGGWQQAISAQAQRPVTNQPTAPPLSEHRATLRQTRPTQPTPHDSNDFTNAPQPPLGANDVIEGERHMATSTEGFISTPGALPSSTHLPTLNRTPPLHHYQYPHYDNEYSQGQSTETPGRLPPSVEGTFPPPGLYSSRQPAIPGQSYDYYYYYPQYDSNDPQWPTNGVSGRSNDASNVPHTQTTPSPDVTNASTQQVWSGNTLPPARPTHESGQRLTTTTHAQQMLTEAYDAYYEYPHYNGDFSQTDQGNKQQTTQTPTPKHPFLYENGHRVYSTVFTTLAHGRTAITTEMPGSHAGATIQTTASPHVTTTSGDNVPPPEYHYDYYYEQQPAVHYDGREDMHAEPGTIQENVVASSFTTTHKTPATSASTTQDSRVWHRPTSAQGALPTETAFFPSSAKPTTGGIDDVATSTKSLPPTENSPWVSYDYGQETYYQPHYVTYDYYGNPLHEPQPMQSNQHTPTPQDVFPHELTTEKPLATTNDFPRPPPFHETLSSTRPFDIVQRPPATTNRSPHPPLFHDKKTTEASNGFPHPPPFRGRQPPLPTGGSMHRPMAMTNDFPQQSIFHGTQSPTQRVEDAQTTPEQATIPPRRSQGPLAEYYPYDYQPLPFDYETSREAAEQHTTTQAPSPTPPRLHIHQSAPAHQRVDTSVKGTPPPPTGFVWQPYINANEYATDEPRKRPTTTPLPINAAPHVTTTVKPPQQYHYTTITGRPDLVPQTLRPTLFPEQNRTNPTYAYFEHNRPGFPHRVRTHDASIQLVQVKFGPTESQQNASERPRLVWEATISAKDMQPNRSNSAQLVADITTDANNRLNR